MNIDKSLILNRLKEVKNLSTERELADFLGVNPQTLSNWRNRNSLDFDTLFTKCVGIDLDWLINGEINNNSILSQKKEIQDFGLRNFPLLELEAFAGAGDEFMNGMETERLHEQFVIPSFDGVHIDFMIKVKGSSMYPKYNSGDVVACRLINEILYLQWNKVYVVDTHSNGVMIKRLKKGQNEDSITLKSDNKDYDEFDIPKTDIRTLALVVGVIRLE